MSAVLNTGALAGKVVFVTGASRGIGSDIQFIVAVYLGVFFVFDSVRCYHQSLCKL